MSEVEVKLELEEGGHADVRSLPTLGGSPASTKRQLSIYFDTPGGKLAKQGCTLRLRLVEGQWVQTAKLASAAGGLFERGEWDWNVAGDRPEPERLAQLPLAIGSAERFGRKLKPILRSEVERTSWQVAVDDSRLQVDLDVGTLCAGERTTIIEEVEFELLEGPADGMVRLAREVAGHLSAKLGVLSKAGRGAALLDGSLDQPVKAAPVEVTEGLSVAEAFAAIVHACLRHFRRNEGLVISRRDSTALHQARVAMRRLRSAFTLFKPVIGADLRWAALREELRWFTNQLGDARNLDVYLSRDLTPEERVEASDRRERAYDQVIAAMADARSRVLMIDLTGWAAIGGWRGASRAVQPIGAFAAKRLDRLWGTVEPTGRSLARMDEESRHQLRIQVKKMRYAVEFFDRLFPASKAKKRFGVAVEAVQEALGKLNDMATARTIKIGDESGWWQEQSEELSSLRDAELAMKQLGKAGPFWRRPA